MKPDISNLPKNPGVYLYYNSTGHVIYIGKAKNLRNRIRSYWSNKDRLEPAKQEMLKEISRVEYVVVDNEKEALLLEAGLIKKHLPKYNIVLRDDKSWTYIVITAEASPRIITTRRSSRIKGEYFGPYTKAATAKTLVRLLHQILPLRTCKRDLSKLPNGLVCMQYHLGKCLGPCEKKISGNEYAKLIEKARHILKGDTKEVLRYLELEMRQSSDKREYEKAAVFRNKISALRSLTEKQHVVHPILENQDIVDIASGDKLAIVTIMQLRSGRLLDTFHYTIENKLQYPEQELLEQFVTQFYGQNTVRPSEIALPFRIATNIEKALLPLRVAYPKRGTKKRLLVLAGKNAWLNYHKKSQTTPLPAELYELKKIFNLPELPIRIEAYDISNISGNFAVGAMVVALNGKLTPSGYRKFKIKTIHSADDVHMMREMLQRRQNHPDWGEPDLIVLDGGKPQLNTVYPILKKTWQDKVVALAKQKEELFLPGRKNSLRLSKSNPALLLLMRIRDAAHKQAIKYYRMVHKREWKK